MPNPDPHGGCMIVGDAGSIRLLLGSISEHEPDTLDRHSQLLVQAGLVDETPSADGTISTLTATRKGLAIAKTQQVYPVSDEADRHIINMGLIDLADTMHILVEIKPPVTAADAAFCNALHEATGRTCILVREGTMLRGLTKSLLQNLGYHKDTDASRNAQALDDIMALDPEDPTAAERAIDIAMKARLFGSGDQIAVLWPRA